MTTKTGEGLAQYALAQLGRPYWWGTFGQTASAALLAQKRAQYPEYYTADDFKSQFGLDWGSMTAMAVMYSLPVIAVTLALQRRIVAGMTFGAVNG